MEPAQAKKFVAFNKDEKGVGDMKTALTSGMEMQNVAFSLLGFGLALVQYFFTMPTFGMVIYPVPLYVGSV